LPKSTREMFSGTTSDGSLCFLNLLAPSAANAMESEI
jgi:hypothetical protein